MFAQTYFDMGWRYYYAQVSYILFFFCFFFYWEFELGAACCIIIMLFLYYISFRLSQLLLKFLCANIKSRQNFVLYFHWISIVQAFVHPPSLRLLSIKATDIHKISCAIWSDNLMFMSCLLLPHVKLIEHFCWNEWHYYNHWTWNKREERERKKDVSNNFSLPIPLPPFSISGCAICCCQLNFMLKSFFYYHNNI